jgi:hypothetical protein
MLVQVLLSEQPYHSEDLSGQLCLPADSLHRRLNNLIP